MDKRYQVFVSSTFLDLREERQAVQQSLLQMDAMPAGMELFPAADDDAWTLIKKVIDESDYYLLVIGGKYGSSDDEGVSFTEKEYDYAIKQRKPVMAFLHGEPDAIPAGKVERSEELQQKLDSFRDKVEKKKHVKYWKSAEQLAGQVALSFSFFAKNYPAPGWIRGDQAASAETLAELHALRKANAALAADLHRASHEPPPGTEEFAQGEDVFELGVRLQFQLSGLPVSSKLSSYQSYYYVAELEWDEILRAIGQRMLDEADEDDLERTLKQYVDSYHRHVYSAEIEKWIEDRTKSKVSFYNLRSQLDAEDFGTVIVQLKALGYIDKSQRQRSVKDRGAYWSLTPYGETRLVALRALRKEDAIDDATEQEPGNGDAEEPPMAGRDGHTPD